MSKSKFLSACKPSANKDLSTGFGFCSVTFGWDINDSTYIRELLVSNKANGYHDILARIDLRTYRRLAWEKNMAFFLVEFYDPDLNNGETRLGACPRGLLESVTQKMEQHGEGWKCMAGSEFEVGDWTELWLMAVLSIRRDSSVCARQEIQRAETADTWK